MSEHRTIVELEDEDLDQVSGGGILSWLSSLFDRKPRDKTVVTGRHTEREAADDPSTARPNPPRGGGRPQ